jgi:putative heme iron utilization protein
VKPQRVRCKLAETIEQPYSDVLAHTPEVCKGTHLYNRYPAIMDDHDSWGMCITSAECKTVITAVFTVMSGMDPHMISGTRVGFG